MLWFRTLAAFLVLLAAFQSAQADEEIARGKILIANEALSDPHFDSAVVLIVGHSNLGTLGLIVNRPLKKGAIYFGGPVKVEGQRALAASRFTIADAIHIHGNLYFLDNAQYFKRLLENSDTNDGQQQDSKAITSIRVYEGISSWIPGQLQAEIRAGAWYLQEGTEEMVFSDNDSLWQELISNIHSQWVQAMKEKKTVRDVLHPTYNASAVQHLAKILKTIGR
jgi:putative transcriptional regulator